MSHAVVDYVGREDYNSLQEMKKKINFAWSELALSRYFYDLKLE